MTDVAPGNLPQVTDAAPGAGPDPDTQAPPFFLIQNDYGTVADANSYCDIDYFIAYCQSRGRPIIDKTTGNQYSALKIAVALIVGRDYMDSRFSFVGFRQEVDQSTEWPRLSAYDNSMCYITGITDILMRAQCEYAYIALTCGRPLNPNPVRDPSGALVQSYTTQTGPIIENVRYVLGAVFVDPVYPTADRILYSRGYIMQSGRLIRA